MCVNTSCAFLNLSIANINDRSQVGFRDSEIAIIIEDTDMVDSRMNGEPVSFHFLPAMSLKSMSQRKKSLGTYTYSYIVRLWKIVSSRKVGSCPSDGPIQGALGIAAPR